MKKDIFFWGKGNGNTYRELMQEYYLQNCKISPAIKRQINMRIKVILFLMIAGLMQVNATGFAQKVTIKMQQSSIKKIITELGKQSGYDFVYDAKVLAKASPISIDVVNATLTEALDRCFKGQPIQYKIEGKGVIISENTRTANETGRPTTILQERIKGRIVDQKGNPLAGASIQVLNTNRSTRSDAEGQFELSNVPSTATLSITYLGYQTLTLKATADLSTIVLKNLDVNIDEVEVVINTGYQSISKERSTGAFVKPDMNVVGERSATMNILQRLDGLVPGLAINNSPGATANPLLIRGLSTINANRSPLVVVDGIVSSDVSIVNPNDVADITVLKDATAASIWGARATNGVIVITTKKGDKQGKAKVVYDGFINLKGTPEYDYFPTLNSAEYIKASTEIFDFVNWPYNTASAHNPNSKRVGIAPDKQILYDMARGVLDAQTGRSMLDSLAAISNLDQIGSLWYQPAFTTNHNLSISGGKDWHSFYSSLAYTKDQYAEKGRSNDRYKINVRQDFEFGKRFKAYLINDITNGINKSRRPIAVDSRFLPYQLFQDAQGNSLSMPYMGSVSEETRAYAEQRSKISLDYDPIKDQYNGDTKGNALNTRSVLGLNLNLTSDFRFEGVYGYNTENSKNQVYDDNAKYTNRYELVNFTYAPTPESNPVYYLPEKGGKYSVGTTMSRSWTVRNQFVFDKSWMNGMHQLTALAGHEAQDQLIQNNRSFTYGFNRKLLTAPSLDYKTLINPGYKNTVLVNGSSSSALNVNAENLFSEGESNYRFLSYYGNFGYTYNNRYAVNGSIRNDQSNLFGKSKAAQDRSVWSIGGKWIISKEDFFNSLKDHVSELSVRATYGLTGNSPIPGSSASEDILSPLTNPRLPNGTGLYIKTPGNPSLTWESTKTTNFGLDFGLVGNRLSGSIDYYNKQTYDLLGPMEINPLTGFNTIVGNLGDISNKGIEVTLNSLNLSGNDWSWRTQVNFSYNKNVVKEIKLAQQITSGDDKIRQSYLPGHTAFAIHAYDYVGLDDLGDPLVRLADGTVTKVNKDVMADDVLYMGTAQQPWSGGLFNNLQYKNFNLNVGLVFNMGHVLIRDVNTLYYSEAGNAYINSGDFKSGNFHAEFADRWQKPGDESITNVPSFISSSAISRSRRDVNHYIYGNLNVLDASYIKIRDIMLRYKLPQSLLEKSKISQVSFNAQVSNLMLWKANKAGIDPEFQNTRSGWSGSRVMRTDQGLVTFGVNLSF